MGGDSLPAGAQVQTVDLGGQVGQQELQVGEQGEVVGGNVGVRTAADIVLQPVGVQGPQDAQHVEAGPGVEDVVDDTLGRRGRG